MKTKYYIAPEKLIDIKWLEEQIRSRLSVSQAELLKQAIQVFNNLVGELRSESPFELYLTGATARDLVLRHLRGDAYTQAHSTPVLMDIIINLRQAQEGLDSKFKDFFTEFCEQVTGSTELYLARDFYQHKWMNYYHASGAYFVMSSEDATASLLSSVHMKINLGTGEIIFRDKQSYQNFNFNRIEIHDITQLTRGTLDIDDLTIRKEAAKRAGTCHIEYPKIFQEEIDMMHRIKLLGHTLYVACAMLPCGFKYGPITREAVFSDKVKLKEIIKIRNNVLNKKTAANNAFVPSDSKEEVDTESVQDDLKEYYQQVRYLQRLKIGLIQLKSKTPVSKPKSTPKLKSKSNKEEEKSEDIIPDHELVIAPQEPGEPWINVITQPMVSVFSPVIRDVKYSIVSSANLLFALTALTFIWYVWLSDEDNSTRAFDFFMRELTYIFAFYLIDKYLERGVIAYYNYELVKFSKDPSWEPHSFIRILWIINKVGIKNIQWDQNSPLKIIFLAHILDINKNLNLSNNLIDILKAIIDCYGSLEQASQAEYLFLSQTAPIGEQLDFREKSRRLINNYFVASERIHGREAAYVRALKTGLEYLDIKTFYRTAYHHLPVPSKEQYLLTYQYKSQAKALSQPALLANTKVYKF